MKVSVNYGERIYGNSSDSPASEIRICRSDYEGSSIDISIHYGAPQAGRSWDWTNVGSVGGAKIEMRLADAVALARTILEFSSAMETNDPYKELLLARLRIRNRSKPKRLVESILKRDLGKPRSESFESFPAKA